MTEQALIPRAPETSPSRTRARETPARPRAYRARGDSTSAISRYLSDIRAYPPLSREQEQSLARNVKTGCEDSRNELVRSNLGFVVKVAREYANIGLPFEDLLNEGNLGLIEAARRFDATKGTKFVTYAVWWIRKSIFKALSERSQLVRVPSYQLKRVREIRETEKKLSATLGRKPRRDEISLRLDRSVSKVDQALQFSLHGVSLDQKVSPDRDQAISDFLVDDSIQTAEEGMIHQENCDLIGQAMRVLTNQEKAVVRYRFGLESGRTMTLKEVGAIMKISRERVRQIECRAKSRIRKIFDERRAIKSPPRRPRTRRPCSNPGLLG
jgi:RNA polymerase primary sigma factor